MNSVSFLERKSIFRRENYTQSDNEDSRGKRIPLWNLISKSVLYNSITITAKIDRYLKIFNNNSELQAVNCNYSGTILNICTSILYVNRGKRQDCQNTSMSIQHGKVLFILASPNNWIF